MLTLHHPKSRAYLKQHLPAIRTGAEHLKETLAIEFGERAAVAAPTAIFDNAARKAVRDQADTLVDDFLQWLEGQQ